jgi:magnesium transporter
LKAEVSELQDVEHAKDIVDLLRYDEDTAGGIMHKEWLKSMKIGMCSLV